MDCFIGKYLPMEVFVWAANSCQQIDDCSVMDLIF